MTNQEFIDAHGQLQAAEQAVKVALKALQLASVRWLSAEAELSKDKIGTLVAEASNNRSEWSGGATSAANIIEGARREAAIELLRQNTR